MDDTFFAQAHIRAALPPHRARHVFLPALVRLDASADSVRHESRATRRQCRRISRPVRRFARKEMWHCHFPRFPTGVDWA